MKEWETMALLPRGKHQEIVLDFQRGESLPI